MESNDFFFDDTGSAKEEDMFKELSAVASNDEITSFGIEYDDDVILAFNPKLRDDIGAYPVANYIPSEFDMHHTEDSENSRVIQNTKCVDFGNVNELSSNEGFDLESTQNQANGDGNTDKKVCVESQTRDGEVTVSCDKMDFGRCHEIQRLTAEIVLGIRRKIPSLEKFRQELFKMREDLQDLRKEYSTLDSMYRKTTNIQKRTTTSAKAYIDDLNSVIYQKRIIDHLVEADKEMKVFECHLTADRGIIFVDSESKGMDIDLPVQISASQAFKIVEKEFKRGFVDREPGELSDV